MIKVCAVKLVKSVNYTGSGFFRKKMKIMLVMTNYTKNYASAIRESLVKVART